MKNDLDFLIKKLLSNTPYQYRGIVLESISWAQKFHAAHKRLSGENYIFHSCRVANTVAEFNSDVDSIIAAIVHSILYKVEEDKLESYLEEIEMSFGGEVCSLLRILKEINQGTSSSQTDRKVITKYILNNSSDIRAVLIKLADVLDDMRTIEYLSEEQISDKAHKVFEIYGPLSSYLNLEDMRKEIEEIAFKFSKPEEFKFISEKMEKEGLNEKLLSKYIIQLEEMTSDILDYKPKIFGRIKSKYSILKKLKKLENEGKETLLSSINDRIAISIITQKEEDCFLIKMFLEEKVQLEEKKTDDYITIPKPNGFQALQVSALFKDIKDVFIEIQILTYRMYYINTYGPASHLAYKASQNRFAKPTDSFNWIKDLHRKITKSKNLRKQSRTVPIKADIFKENIYVFTPNGEIIELPNNSTGLDFAYRIHTQVGHKAMFIKVDGVKKNLNEVLNTGQEVEVLLSNEKKYPNPKWLDFIKTDSAKEKIKKGLKEKANNINT